MPQRYFKYFFLYILFLVTWQTFAQKAYSLRFNMSGVKLDTMMPSGCKNIIELRDTSLVYKAFQNCLLTYYGLGYLTARGEVTKENDSSFRATINQGNRYQWANLNKGNVTDDVLTASGWRIYEFNNKPVYMPRIEKRFVQMLTYLENNGYPFASIQLGQIFATDSTVSASLILDKGDLFKFDTIEIIGDANIKSWFLGKYLGIKKGAVYDEQLIRTIDARLSQLPYLQLTRSSVIYFVGDEAKPVVYLSNRKSSSVDGIIGFAPQSNANNNRLLLTGEANLKLQNLFGTGRSIDLAYRSFLNGSQELRTRMIWPYLFKTNIGLDYEFNLLRFDSSFLDVKHDIGAQYRIIGNDYVKFFYQSQRTTLLRTDTVEIKRTARLPQNNDLRIDLYGVAIKRTKYDYFLNPRKGFAFELISAAGLKRIVKNSAISELRFVGDNGNSYGLYDSINLRSVQYRFTFKGDVYIPLGRSATWRIECLGAHVQSESIFFSELFRIGGIRTLKGFDEQSIFASSYVIINSEWRYLLQQNSNVMLFWNGAWYQNTIRNPVITDRPFGLGAGLNFETGAGIFSLYYAVGRAFDNAIEFNRAKVHFGFINYF